MLRAMKEYKNEVLKPSMGWLKKHWKGYTAFTVLICAAEVLWIFRDNVKEKVNELYRKIFLGDGEF